MKTVKLCDDKYQVLQVLHAENIVQLPCNRSQQKRLTQCLKHWCKRSTY